MAERPRNDVSDGFSWWCRQCTGRKSIRDGSFFSKSHLSLQKWFLLMYWWAREFPVTNTAKEAEVDKNAAVDVYRWLREVCSTKLLQTPIVLGGPGIVVQIDGSQFRHKPKVANTLLDHSHKTLSSLYNILSASPWTGYFPRSVGFGVV